MYYLNRDGSITNPGLPDETYAVSISPDNEKVAYVKGKEKGGDSADIYLRENGEDRLLVEGQKNIFRMLSWSEDSDTLFYEKSDLLFRPGLQSNWSVGISNSESPRPVSHASD